MKDRNRNKYVLFLFSLLPGAVEMYVGLMHMGISLLALFLAGFALAVGFDTADMLMLVPVLIWFFGFFHARNLLHCDDETFAAIKDEYIWNEFFGREVKLFAADAPRKGIAAFLIVAGLGILWEAFVSTVLGVLQFNHSDYRVWEVRDLLSVVPKAALSVVLIVCGRRLIREKKAAMEAETAAVNEEAKKTAAKAKKTMAEAAEDGAVTEAGQVRAAVVSSEAAKAELPAEAAEEKAAEVLTETAASSAAESEKNPVVTVDAAVDPVSEAIETAPDTAAWSASAEGQSGEV